MNSNCFYHTSFSRLFHLLSVISLFSQFSSDLSLTLTQAVRPAPNHQVFEAYVSPKLFDQQSSGMPISFDSVSEFRSVFEPIRVIRSVPWEANCQLVFQEPIGSSIRHGNQHQAHETILASVHLPSSQHYDISERDEESLFFKWATAADIFLADHSHFQTNSELLMTLTCEVVRVPWLRTLEEVRMFEAKQTSRLTVKLQPTKEFIDSLRDSRYSQYVTNGNIFKHFAHVPVHPLKVQIMQIGQRLLVTKPQRKQLNTPIEIQSPLQFRALFNPIIVRQPRYSGIPLTSQTCNLYEIPANFKPEHIAQVSTTSHNSVSKNQISMLHFNFSPSAVQTMFDGYLSKYHSKQIATFKLICNSMKSDEVAFKIQFDRKIQHVSHGGLKHLFAKQDENESTLTTFERAQHHLPPVGSIFADDEETEDDAKQCSLCMERAHKAQLVHKLPADFQLREGQVHPDSHSKFCLECANSHFQKDKKPSGVLKSYTYCPNCRLDISHWHPIGIQHSKSDSHEAADPDVESLSGRDKYRFLANHFYVGESSDSSYP